MATDLIMLNLKLRPYERKWCTDSLKQALFSVFTKHSNISRTAEEFKIPYATLWRYVKEMKDILKGKHLPSWDVYERKSV